MGGGGWGGVYDLHGLMQDVIKGVYMYVCQCVKTVPSHWVYLSTALT